MENHQIKRRPIRARDTKWAAAAARWLTRSGLKPNQISILSVVFASIAGACLLLASTQTWGVRVALLMGAAACIPLRLLCNMFDGMVAVEGGRQTKAGEIYNELPDRISDAIILVCAGYFSGGTCCGVELGWTAAILAVITAYVRTLGAMAGASQQFCGPMAKQQRMAVIIAACLLTIVEGASDYRSEIMPLALGIVIGGCVVTIGRRMFLIMKELDFDGAP